MQLKKIKLSGFKSFVDPTIVLVPSRLVAVVGPNGCGKSNIIDAVCWVMGESSAKQLRGESLTDVIFNGSSARKPVGQASVELIFDNQDGGLQGEYGKYAEISIRRLITREGDSNYFLNGTRCRRRDIIDIFLGTGLGPRSYSIIGQNMISRVIEAKPEEMRIYLEEAAGVSKYKERRRETSLRITHTKDNLARVNDVRTELEKQLSTLKRQATIAEKYKILKQTERTLRAQWLVIQWRHLDSRLVQSTLQIQQHETGLESYYAELTRLNLGLEEQREQQHTLTEQFQDVQRRYYAIGNQITHIEQEIRHTEARKQQWQLDIAQVNHDKEVATQELEDAEHLLKELIHETHQLEPALQEAMQTVTLISQTVSESDQAMQKWQIQWDDFNQRAAKTTQTAEVEQTRIQHLEQRFESITKRQAKLIEEQENINFSHLEEELLVLTQKAKTANEEASEQDQKVISIRDEITVLQKQQQQSTTELNQIRNQLQRLSGQQASLEALQKTALGQRNNRVVQWLTKHNFDKNLRLAQGIEVESGWEYAVEKILGLHLQAVCVNDLTDITAVIDQFKEGSLCVFATKPTENNASIKASTLLEKIKSKWSLTSLLSGIYVAENQEDALLLCASLEPHESVITREGVWMSASWIRLSKDENPEAGIFQREAELKQLTKQISDLSKTQEKIEIKINEQQEQLKILEGQRNELQKCAHQAYAQSAEIQAQQKMHQQKLAESKLRFDRYCHEQEENREQLEKTQHELTQSRSLWQSAMSQLEQHAKQREELTRERDAWREQLQLARQQLNQAKEDMHQQEIRLQTTKSQRSAVQQNISRLQSHLVTLCDRETLLQKELISGESIEHLEKTLEASLVQRLQTEEELQSARAKVEDLEQDLRKIENQRQQIEREIAKYRDLLETLRVDQQGYKVKSETILEQINETGFSLEEILKDLPEEANQEQWFSDLEQTTQRITRLGPINLVAIEEYSACAERKDYLDSQYNDLQEGLTTLENAIAKIDKETRVLFKETFDKVNERFQELFPQVFGGGRAYLELTGDNLLDAGISIMACPPGKRNSTIHLLSGGEKAMTAIALVFSIFHLNPAPFCLLDEVDAPLDDANIARFCDLVKTMSQKTQFIFISHNKLAIEMGEHLMGVTMNEPGVSRLVSVNVEEAVSLAGA